MTSLLNVLLITAWCFRAVLSQDDLGLANGYLDLSVQSMDFQLVKDAQVLVSLQPTDSEFDFLPRDILDDRASNGQYHWGDLIYRYRSEGSNEWIEGDTAADRVAVDSNDGSDVLASSSLENTLPESPMEITREWLEVDGDLGLRFRVTNTGDEPLELGSLGFPAEFNSIFSQRTAEDMRRVCSLSDPYIGLDAGQIRVTPVTGTGQSLLVTPLQNTTVSHFEAYRNLQEPSNEPLFYGSQTFEGFYEWQVLSKAWADDEWGNVEPWNEPTAFTIAPGDEFTTGVRFTLADSVRGYNTAAKSIEVPVARSVPGFIIPRNQPALLWIESSSSVETFTVKPEGALAVEANEDGSYTVTASNSAWGRVRVSIEYEDSRIQTLHYFITKPTEDTLSDLGTFLTTEAYFDEPSDPFGRGPSVMTYDYELGSIVDQDSRTWVAGLSDEGGTGAYVAAIMKQVIQPQADEIDKLDTFVNEVVWGQIQKEDYGVVKSVFFYEPAAAPGYEYDQSIDWGSWTSWNKQQAGSFDRAYNYVHVTAAYWSLYRVARAYPDTVSRTWDWYLDQAQKTIIRAMEPDVGYNMVGLMGETVFGEVLKDLERESKDTMATSLEAAMRERAEYWDSLESPFGSEMAWDSTGQEGVYYWTRHFGFMESAAKTVNSVLGYTPNVPHWGWDGNARRYWDFIYGGKLKRIERQIHHYGSGLNGQVLLAAFRDDPTDTYLLSTGYAAISGPLSNINTDGFPSAAFHSFPNTLKWDAISGDYGGGFLGMALNAGTYIADDEELGIVAYGGIITNGGSAVTVEPRDAVRRRFYIGPLSVLVEIDAGRVEEFIFDAAEGSVSVSLGQQENSPPAEAVTIWVESFAGDEWTASGNGVAESRGGWSLPFNSSATFELHQS